MERTNLYNPGFVGSQFHWWLGQVADSTTWRENQTDSSYDNPEDIPGWGYRYKVRIMGLHDAGESVIPSDQLPWCQVMYSVWGGGQGGSFQTPGIKEGMFVFGFFLDGTDEQVPVIMGVLGNNAKTVIKGIGSAVGEPNTFEPKSAFKDDGSTVTSDSQCAIVDTFNSPPEKSTSKESTDNSNQNDAHSKKKEDIDNEKHSIACAKYGDDLASMNTVMSNFTNKHQKLIDKLNKFPDAASTQKTQEQIENLIDKTSIESAKVITPSMNKVQDFVSKEFSKKTEKLEELANITDRLDLMDVNIKGQKKLSCVFNKIKGDLAGLIGAALKRSLKRKNNQSPPAAAGQVRPQTPQSDLIPPSPPEGFYLPVQPCESEEIIADVLSNTVNEIMTGFDEAIGPIAAGSGTSSKPTLSNALTQENVITNFENGKLFGGLASALAAGAGIDASQSGAITSALKSGNYAAALSSLVDKSGKNVAVGALSSAIQSIDNGDITGAFTSVSGALGIDNRIMAGVGGALSAIKGGNFASLTNAIGGLGGISPSILTNVLGSQLPISGIDIGGFGALGGLNFDMALASTFISTTAAFLECSPPRKCAPANEHTFGAGKGKTELNKNEVGKKVSEKKGDDSFVDMISDDKLKGIYDKAANSGGVPFGVPLGGGGDTSALNLSAPLTGGFDIPTLDIADPSLLNTGLPNAFAENTQPFESFSEYRNRIGKVNNISENVEKKEIKIKPTREKVTIENINLIQEFSKRNPKVDVSGLKSYDELIAEGVTINEIGPNDFELIYPNGKRVISTSLGSSNAPTLRTRYDSLQFEKARIKAEEKNRKIKAEEEKKKREEEDRLRRIEWSKKFPSLYNPDGTRKK